MNLCLGPTKAWYVGVQFDDLRLGRRITWMGVFMGWKWRRRGKEEGGSG